MNRYRIIILAALAAAAVSCTVKEDSLSGPRGIRFTTNLGDYTAVTKATSTEFESGDAVSLFAESPIDELNVKMVYDGRNLVPEKEIFWPEDLDSSTPVTFLGVYPYRTDWEDGSDLSVFSVNADQSTHALYTASDLLGASFMAYKDCETVPLNFTHRLCRLQVLVNDYGDEEDPVSDVYVCDAYGKVRLTLWSTMSVSIVGQKGTIRMGKAENGWWGSFYEAVIPPQAMGFRILVVTEAGRQYAFKADSYYRDYFMESGKQYTVDLSLDPSYASDMFSVEISEWTPDNDSQFGQYVADAHNTEGDWYLESGDYSVQAPAVNFEGYHFEAGIEDSRSYRLKYVNGRRVKYFGLLQSQVVAPGKYELVENGEPFSSGVDQPLVLKLYPAENILLAEEDNEVWSVVGTGPGEAWNNDVDMTRVSFGIYTTDMEYWGEEFRFRCNHDWYKNIGNYDEDIFYPLENTYWYTAYNGLNIRIKSPGIYRLTLDVISQRLAITLLQELKDETYDAMQGHWYRYVDDDHTYDMWISSTWNGSDFSINYDGKPLYASYDHWSGSFSVNFQEIDPRTDEDYGEVSDIIAAWYNDFSEYLFGFYTDVTLFTGTLTDSGEMQIDPGTYNGYPFEIFDIYTYKWGSGVLWSYFGGVELPQTWTRVND